jgi:hypothetical protein
MVLSGCSRLRLDFLRPGGYKFRHSLLKHDENYSARRRAPLLMAQHVVVKKV